MKKLDNRKLTLLLLTAILFSFAASKAWAGGSADYSVEVSQKFGRGMLNLISSPLEIPCTMGNEVSEKGAAGIGAGFFKGIAFFVRRALVGVTEVGTFMIPMEETLPAVCAKKPQPSVQR